MAKILMALLSFYFFSLAIQEADDIVNQSSELYLSELRRFEKEEEGGLDPSIVFAVYFLAGGLIGWKIFFR